MTQHRGGPLSRLLRGVAIGLALLVATPAFAQVAYGSLSQAQQIAVIERALAAGDIGLAQQLLAGSRFDAGDLGYAAALLQARVFRATGQPAAAEALLRQILRERPEFRAVRTELAGLLAENGQRAAARSELRLLAAGARDPDERRAFESLLDTVGGRAGGATAGLRFSGFASLLNDSNINSGTTAQSVLILGVPFPVPASRRETAGQGLRFGGTVVGERALGAGLTGYGAARLTLDEYAGTRFDRQVLDVRAGLRRATAQGFWGIEALADRHWRDRSGAERGLGARVLGARDLGAEWRLSGDLRSSVRRYDANPGGRRVVNAGLMRLDHRLSARARLWGELELARETVAAQPVTGFDRRRIGLGAEGEFAGGMGLSVSLSRGLDDFHAPYPGLAGPRADRRDQINVTLWHRKLQLRGFQPRLSVTQTVNRSNAAIEAYDRVETALSFVRGF